MSDITVTAFRWVPPFAQGLVRDLRVRWALEEAGLPYEERLIGPDDQKHARPTGKLQPFGQVPVLEEDELVLFESGAIVLHIAEQSPGAAAGATRRRGARARPGCSRRSTRSSRRSSTLNSLDMKAPAQRPARAGARPGRRPDRQRLDSLAAFLGEREHLVEGRFTAADLLMTTVLRILRHTDLVSRDRCSTPTRRRCEARPAFQKALDAQMATFAEHAPSPRAVTAPAR